MSTNLDEAKFAESFERVRKLLARKPLRCQDEGCEHCQTSHDHPDLAYGPLQAVLQKRCSHCYVEGYPWLNDEPGVSVPCHACRSSGFLSRLPYWQDADPGALAGAGQAALLQIAIARPTTGEWAFKLAQQFQREGGWAEDSPDQFWVNLLLKWLGES